jgi:hypothetical protein
MPDEPKRGTKTAYIKKIDNLTRQVNRLEDQAARAALTQLREMLNTINGRIVTAEGWRLQNLVNLKHQVEDLINGFDKELAAKITGISQKMFELGYASVDEPLKVSGLQIPAARLSRNVVAVLQGYSSDLIKNISNELRTSIDATLTQSMLGGLSPFDAQRRITQLFGLTDNLSNLTGVSARAEKVFRTETGRVYSIATQARMDQVAEMKLPVLKVWTATGDHRTRSGHLEAHGQTVPIDGFFEVAAQRGGKKERLKFPKDPRGSAENTINCRCRAVTWREGYGDFMPRTTAKVDAEIEQRKQGA